MPIHTGKDKQGHFYQWGKTGKKYYFDPTSENSKNTALNKAEKQQIAIFQVAGKEMKKWE